MIKKILIADWDSTNLEDARFGSIEVDQEKCSGCTWCSQVCPAKTITVVDKAIIMNEDMGCMFCGDCQAICPCGAITLNRKPVYPGYYIHIERGELRKPRLEF